MKRILFFNDSLALGGTEVLLVKLLNHLAESGYRTTLLLPSPSDDNLLLGKLSADISIRYLFASGTSHLQRKIQENIMIFYPRLFMKMKGLNDTDYDEVICFKECFYARIFSKMNIPKILWVHNILFRRAYGVHSLRERLAVWLNKKQLQISQASYDRYNKVICVSDTCKQIYINILHNGKAPDQDIRVISNAINLSEVVCKAAEPIDALPADIIKFAVLTRVSPEKRTDRVINAAARLKDEGYDFGVYILGGAVAEAERNTLANVRDLSDTLFFLGQQQNPFPYIRSCNWLICPSERESFSLAILEAMALHVPVITTNCGGPADIVDGGKYGMLVDNSTEGVYKGMKSALDNRQQAEVYSARSDESVARYDYDNWLNKIELLLCEAFS